MQAKPTSSPSTASNLEILDPDRIAGNQYGLVHHQDSKLCPKSVTRCEQCRVAFNQTDAVVVKSLGGREQTSMVKQLSTLAISTYTFLQSALKTVIRSLPSKQ